MRKKELIFIIIVLFILSGCSKLDLQNGMESLTTAAFIVSAGNGIR